MNDFCECRSCRLRRLWVVAVWALIVAGLVELVLGCAPTIPNLNTTRWAEVQDSVIAKTAPVERLKEFEPLRDLQEKVTPTNLTLRHRILTGDSAQAWKQYRALLKGPFWAEGPSYWRYTRMALPDRVYPPDTAYPYLIAPDGTIPLPEASMEAWRAPSSLPDTVYFPGHYWVRRWRDSTGAVIRYLLVGLGGEEPRLNLHHHPERGMVVLWERGEWVQRPTPYTGFNFMESYESRALRPVMPPGKPDPNWRLKTRKEGDTE